MKRGRERVGEPGQREAGLDGQREQHQHQQCRCGRRRARAEECSERLGCAQLKPSALGLSGC
eukprot:3887225-Prymnesium_polylepis.1